MYFFWETNVTPKIKKLIATKPLLMLRKKVMNISKLQLQRATISTKFSTEHSLRQSIKYNKNVNLTNDSKLLSFNDYSS